MQNQPLHLYPMHLLTTAEKNISIPPRHSTSSCNGISAVVSENQYGVSP